MDVQIRRARKTDLTSIIEMSKGIYDGHDYFPLVFLKWLEEPNRRIIVAEKDEVVIGIRAFHIVDNGKTIVSQSLRVHPKYRGQGIGTLLILAQHRYVQGQFPSLTTERYTTMSTNAGRLAIQRKSLGEKLVLELGIIAFYVDFGSGSNPPKIACATEQIRNIDEAEFQRYMKNGELRKLLQKDVLIIDWEPFKAVEFDASCGLIRQDDCLLVSVQKRDDNSFESEQNHSRKEIICFSHGRVSPRVKYLHWVATIYTENLKLLKLHMGKQLEHARLQARTREFIFSCFLPPRFVSDAKQYVLDKFSLEYVDFFNFNLLLFEKNAKV